MKSKWVVVLLAVAICALVFGVYIWKNMYVSANSVINDRFAPIPEVLQEGQDFTAVLQGLQTHGNVPITVNSGEMGTTNPFE